MAIIGQFTKQANGRLEGNIETLTVRVQAVFEPLDKRGDQSPDYRITFGFADIGAAWKRSGSNNEAYYSVQLDDPSYAAPIKCRLVKTGVERGYSLIWERERKRS